MEVTLAPVLTNQIMEIATQCANLEHGFDVDEAVLYSEVLGLEGRDGECGEIDGGGVGEGVIELWIWV